MSKYERAPKAVADMAKSILEQFETHKPLLDAKVKIDFVMAYGDRDENDNLTGPAITSGGFQSLGVARKMPVKDRAMGRGDCEVMLDGDFWDDEAIPEARKRAVLDHELHHFQVVKDEEDVLLLDSCDRPKLKLRRHDVEVGWFRVVAVRHGAESHERVQAKTLLDGDGQVFWPDILNLKAA